MCHLQTGVVSGLKVLAGTCRRGRRGGSYSATDLQKCEQNDGRDGKRLQIEVGEWGDPPSFLPSICWSDAVLLSDLMIITAAAASALMNLQFGGEIFT